VGEEASEPAEKCIRDEGGRAPPWFIATLTNDIPCRAHTSTAFLLCLNLGQSAETVDFYPGYQEEI
jgi:hypothetical protein